MKKLVLLCLISSLLLRCYADVSYTRVFSNGYVDYNYATKHSLTIAPEVYHYEYKEPGIMKNDGLYYGAHLNYMYSIYPDKTDQKNPYGEQVEKFFVGFQSRFAKGRVDYESNGAGSMNDIDDYVIELRSIFGFEAKLSRSLSLSPYLGFGYRYLNNDSGGRQTTTGFFGYERESNYYYLPLGARLSLSVADQTRVGASVEGDVFLSGKQRSHLGDVVPGFETVENDQETGYGLRASVFIEHEFKRAGVFVEPYIRYWDIDDSEIAIASDFSAWIEPENQTLEAGLKLGAWF
jgi:hypothetical protein